jgi:hypothetical protein
MSSVKTRAVYSENHSKRINILCGQNAGSFANAGGTQVDHWVYRASDEAYIRPGPKILK